MISMRIQEEQHIVWGCVRDSGRQESRDIERRKKESQVNRKRVLKNVNMNPMKEGGFPRRASLCLIYSNVRVGAIPEFLLLAE